MALITSGKSFIRDLDKSGALGIYMPLEGGYEGRYRRRLRANGYVSLHITARGLGDLAAYLTRIHGVRPPHLGKKNIGQDAAVGPIYYIPPMINYQLENLPAKAKGLVMWILEGQVFSRQEREYLVNLPKLEPKVKVILELGGDRKFNWVSLEQTLVSA